MANSSGAPVSPQSLAKAWDHSIEVTNTRHLRTHPILGLPLPVTRLFSPSGPSVIYSKVEHSMAPNTWEAYSYLYKTVISGLFCALGLLLASLLGPFVLRIFHRRKPAAAPVSQAAKVPLIRISKPSEDNETETKLPTPITDQEVQAINDSTSPARSEPMRHPQPEDFFNFVSMLPAPTLEYETQPQHTNEKTSKHQQRVSQKVLPSGQLKTVFESQNGGNGRGWKRRTIVFGANPTPQSPIASPA